MLPPPVAGPGFAVLEQCIAALTHLALTVVASATVIWMSFTELLHAIREYRSAQFDLTSVDGSVA